MNARKNELHPIHYKIHLEFDLREEHHFNGRTELLLNSERPTSQIILNIENLAIWSCTLKKKGEMKTCSFRVNPSKQELQIILPEKMKKEFSIRIEYMGKYSPDLLGIYRCKYKHENTEQYMISTQFEEHFARRAFPCFDHPSKKATFEIEFVIDKDLVGISNTKIKHEHVLKNRKKLVVFEKTPKMCTYLLYFGVGHLEFLEDESGKHLVRVVSTPGKSKHGTFALDIAKKSLEFMEKFTRLAYPLSKCDLIGVPDFPFGAMENWGSIAYRETFLFLYPEFTSNRIKILIAEITAHEISHFWFGDLVSPHDWKDIWLNESFASYFTLAIPSEYFPEWRSWEFFLIEVYSPALERDGLIETFAVELPGDVKGFASPAKTDIVYKKGASILRMLEGFLGELPFRKGINHFLKKYQFVSANTTQYWESFEEATGEPVKEFAESWIHQAGYPLLHVKREKNLLILEQEVFTYLPCKNERIWMIPIEILLFLDNGNTKKISHLMSDRTLHLKIPKETSCFKLNVEQKGFYRVKYEKKNLEQLGEFIKQGKLSAIEKHGIENDLFALLKRGDYSLAEYLEYLSKYFLQEEEFLPLMSINPHLLYLHLIINSRDEEIREVINKIYSIWFNKFGIFPKDSQSEPLHQKIIREAFLWNAYFMKNEEVKEMGENLFKKALNGEKIDPDLVSSVYKIGAATHHEAMNFFLKKIFSPETSEIEKLYILEALGCFDQEKRIKEAFKLTIKHVPSSSRHYVFNSMGRNPIALKLIWDLFLKYQDELKKEGPLSYSRALVSLIPTAGLFHEKEVKEFLEAELKNKDPSSEDTIKMTMELLEINLNLRRRNE
ncbi:MAG: M1 family metallopeptidase [Promethearchaeota archaeon]